MKHIKKFNEEAKHGKNKTETRYVPDPLEAEILKKIGDNKTNEK